MLTPLFRSDLELQKEAGRREDRPHRVPQVVGNHRQNFVSSLDGLPQGLLGRPGFGHVGEGENSPFEHRAIFHGPEGDLDRERFLTRSPQHFVLARDRSPGP